MCLLLQHTSFKSCITLKGPSPGLTVLSWKAHSILWVHMITSAKICKEVNQDGGGDVQQGMALGRHRCSEVVHVSTWHFENYSRWRVICVMRCLNRWIEEIIEDTKGMSAFFLLRCEKCLRFACLCVLASSHHLCRCVPWQQNCLIFCHVPPLD